MGLGGILWSPRVSALLPPGFTVPEETSEVYSDPNHRFILDSETRSALRMHIDEHEFKRYAYLAKIKMMTLVNERQAPRRLCCGC